MAGASLSLFYSIFYPAANTPPMTANLFNKKLEQKQIKYDILLCKSRTNGRSFALFVFFFQSFILQPTLHQ